MTRILTIAVFAASVVAGIGITQASKAALSQNGTSLNGASASAVVLMDVRLP